MRRFPPGPCFPFGFGIGDPRRGGSAVALAAAPESTSVCLRSGRMPATGGSSPTRSAPCPSRGP
eukprot:6876418-Pyramimonas_sp.AAC.1